MKLLGPIVLALVVVAFIAILFTAPPFAHFVHFYFFPLNEAWWHGAVWGNVLADFPNIPVVLALGAAAYFLHRRAMAPLHEKVDKLVAAHEVRAEEHGQHMAAIKGVLDALDPSTESDSLLDTIADRVDEQTESGIGAILQRLPTDNRGGASLDAGSAENPGGQTCRTRHQSRSLPARPQPTPPQAEAQTTTRSPKRSRS